MRHAPDQPTERRGPVVRCALVLLCILLPGLLAAGPYDYQDRGDRREGIRPKPVSGSDMELVSVRADTVPQGADPADALLLAFHLPEALSAHITVRERDYRFYYWLDQVRPAAPWRPGAVNRYRWETRTVLDWLMGQGLAIDDLGVVVRLGDARPSLDERVAPAVLAPAGAAADAVAGRQAPAAPQAWRFSFKTNLPANLVCELRAERAPSDAAPLWTKPLPRVAAGRPFDCTVPARRLAAGDDYRLTVTGWSLETSQPLRQDVRFRHAPVLP